MWSYKYRRYVGETKICGVINQKIFGGKKSMWSFKYRRYVGETRIFGVINKEDMWGKEKYMEL